MLLLVFVLLTHATNVHVQLLEDYREAYDGSPLDSEDYFEQDYAEVAVSRQLPFTGLDFDPELQDVEMAESEYDGFLTLPLSRMESDVGAPKENAQPQQQAQQGQEQAQQGQKQAQQGQEQAQQGQEQAQQGQEQGQQGNGAEEAQQPQQIQQVEQPKCQTNGIFCKCGFQDVQFTHQNQGDGVDCYNLKGVCQYCGKSDRVVQVGFDYKHFDKTGEDVYRMRVLKEDELWTPPEYNYKCAYQHVLTGVKLSHVRMQSLGNRDFYVLKVKCTKLKGEDDPNLRPMAWDGQDKDTNCPVIGKFQVPGQFDVDTAGQVWKKSASGWGSSALLSDAIGPTGPIIGVSFACTHDDIRAGLQVEPGSVLDTFKSLNYALGCKPNGILEVWESGNKVLMDTGNVYDPSQLNTIQIVDGKVQYWAGNRMLYTSETPIQATAHFQAALNTQGSKITNVGYVCAQTAKSLDAETELSDQIDVLANSLPHRAYKAQEHLSAAQKLARLEKLVPQQSAGARRRLPSLDEFLGSLPEGDAVMFELPMDPPAEHEVGAKLDPYLRKVLKDFSDFTRQNSRRAEESKAENSALEQINSLLGSVEHEELVGEAGKDEIDALIDDIFGEMPLGEAEEESGGPFERQDAFYDREQLEAALGVSAVDPLREADRPAPVPIEDSFFKLNDVDIVEKFLLGERRARMRKGFREEAEVGDGLADEAKKVKHKLSRMRVVLAMMTNHGGRVWGKIVGLSGMINFLDGIAWSGKKYHLWSNLSSKTVLFWSSRTMAEKLLLLFFAALCTAASTWVLRRLHGGDKINVEYLISEEELDF